MLQGQISAEVAPLITVAMPVYNAGKYLRLAVMSIVRQTFTDWELLIIDDGSTDHAIEGIADIQDPRIRILRDGHNRGLAARLNEAIDLARGQYLARMDQDDVSYPNRFMRQVAILQADPRIDLLAARAITIDENNNMSGLFPYRLSHDEICARPWGGFYFPHPTWMGRIEWFRAHRYAQPGPYFCEDQELLLRSYRTSRFATVNEILFAYRIRRKINWHKLAKTRRMVKNIQAHYFMQTRQWHFVLFAVLVYVFRLAKDWLLWASPGFVRNFGNFSSTALSEWRSVSSKLIAEAG